MNKKQVIRILLQLEENELIKAKDIFLKSILKYYKKNHNITDSQTLYAKRILKSYDINIKPKEKKIEPGGFRFATIDQIHDDGKYIRIDFDHPNKESLKELKNRIRKIRGYKHKRIEGIWRVPVDADSITKLEGLEFKFDKSVITEKNRIFINKNMESIEIKNDFIIPRRYQKKGVLFIEKAGGQVLLADDMGLGKTMQSILWKSLHPKERPVVVLCPSGLKIKWQREILTMIPNADIEVLYGQTPITITSKDYIILNYRIFKYHLKELLRIKPKVFIIDECHMLNNKKSEIYSKAKELSNIIPYKIGLTGTPIVNDITELWNILQIIKPNIWPDFWNFIYEYCKVEYKTIKFKTKNKNARDYNFRNVKNTEKLHEILLNTVMLRRLKTQVLKELPPKSRSIIPLRLKNYTEYKKLVNDFDFNTDKRTLRNKVEALKQLIIAEKMPFILDWIDNFLKSDEKLIVFTTHHWTIDTIYDKYKKIGLRMDGRDSHTRKQDLVDQFDKDDKKKIMICNLKSGSLGHDMVASSNILMTEFGWTSHIHEQAEDRANRIGQIHAVMVWYIVALHTIEERIMKTIDRKKITSDSIIDGTKTSEDELLTEILNELKGIKYGN